MNSYEQAVEQMRGVMDSDGWQSTLKGLTFVATVGEGVDLCQRMALSVPQETNIATMAVALGHLLSSCAASRSTRKEKTEVILAIALYALTVSNLEEELRGTNT